LLPSKANDSNSNTDNTKKFISVYGLSAQLDDGEALPKVGSNISGGKEGCIRRMLGNDNTIHDNELPQNSMLQYPRKPRVIPMENASLLFFIYAHSVHDPKHARIQSRGTGTGGTHSDNGDDDGDDAGRYISSHFPATTLKKITKTRDVNTLYFHLSNHMDEIHSLCFVAR
jgi:hypothetical protein